MSFCSDVKNELASLRPSYCCRLPLIYGFMLFGRSFSFKRICLQTGNEKMAEAYCELAEQVYKVKPNVTVGGSKRPTYKAELLSDTDKLKILASVDYGMTDRVINTTVFKRDCCPCSFLRGVFLACGNVNDPEKEYRAEFLIKNDKAAEELHTLLFNYGINFKKTKRNHCTVLYSKESEVIADFLTLIGCSHRSIDIMNTKIYKSVKNNINRARNCDNANISKTVEASINQRIAIDYLEKSDRLYSLPHELLSAALLRKENPDSTLKELCHLSNEPLTISGLNHRLQRITAIYEELKNK